MLLRRALQRRSWNKFTLISAVIVVAIPFVVSAAAQDIPCLQKVAHDRANTMHGIFDDYNNEAKRLGDKLGDDESNSLSQTDLGFRQTELDRINADYSYGMNAAWANLTARLKQIWSDYQQQRVACGFGTTNQTPSYPTNQPPPFGNTQYGNTTQYLPAAPQAPIKWNGGIYQQPICPRQILPTPPPNCTYSCQRDWNGCKICNLQCSRIIRPLTSCACPMLYAPVCGNDGRTYSNACLAACAGCGVRYGGLCR